MHKFTLIFDFYKPAVYKYVQVKIESFMLKHFIWPALCTCNQDPLCYIYMLQFTSALIDAFELVSEPRYNTSALDSGFLSLQKQTK